MVDREPSRKEMPGPPVHVAIIRYKEGVDGKLKRTAHVVLNEPGKEAVIFGYSIRGHITVPGENIQDMLKSQKSMGKLQVWGEARHKERKVVLGSSTGDTFEASLDPNSGIMSNWTQTTYQPTGEVFCAVISVSAEEAAREAERQEALFPRKTPI